MRHDTGHGNDNEVMIRGSLWVKRRRCGKDNCRCAQGDLHESPALTYRVEGRSQTIVLADSDVAWVQAGLDRFHAARADLDRTADEGIALLQARVARRREGRL